jgi:hypothetical protein
VFVTITDFEGVGVAVGAAALVPTRRARVGIGDG